MTDDEQERFICEQIAYLKNQYIKACEPWFKQLSYIRSLRIHRQIILPESDYKQPEQP